MLRSFLWKRTENEKSFLRVSWTKVCVPKLRRRGLRNPELLFFSSFLGVSSSRDRTKGSFLDNFREREHRSSLVQYRRQDRRNPSFLYESTFSKTSFSPSDPRSATASASLHSFLSQGGGASFNLVLHKIKEF